MAERRITVFGCFKNQSLSAGDSATSGPHDLREKAINGYFSLSHRIAAGTSTTCGTTVFSYQGCSVFDGPYVTPASSVAIGTAGSHGTYGTANIWTFEPELMPFMKIIATQIGSGNLGANTNLAAVELIVQ